jgi:hypothetical protein
LIFPLSCRPTSYGLAARFEAVSQVVLYRFGRDIGKGHLAKHRPTASNGRVPSLHASADAITSCGLLDDDGTDDCACGADDVAVPGEKFRNLRFQMIADNDECN